MVGAPLSAAGSAGVFFIKNTPGLIGSAGVFFIKRKAAILNE